MCKPNVCMSTDELYKVPAPSKPLQQCKHTFRSALYCDANRMVALMGVAVPPYRIKHSLLMNDNKSA